MFLENWDEILKKAWSVRFIVLAGLFTAADVCFPFIEPWAPDWISPTGLGVAAGALSGAAVVARIVAQRNLPREAR